jgi:tRNA threonylcarbamoyladenosine biosynthesis protein TsaE
MGAGKTTLIKAIARQLGVTNMTSSPTFSLVNEYETADGRILYHFDLYRLNSEEEAYDMGIDEYFYSGNLCLIEWPEKTPNLIPLDHTIVTLKQQPDGRRHLVVK